MVIINHYISSELAEGHVKLAERLCHGWWLFIACPCCTLLLPRNLNCAVERSHLCACDTLPGIEFIKIFTLKAFIAFQV